MMDLMYAVNGTGEVLRAGSGRNEGGAAVVGRVQPRAIGAGLGRESSWGPLWCVIRHDGACKVTITPIVDGTEKTSLAVEHTLSDTGGAPEDVVVKVYLSEPVTWPGDADPFSNQALRGVFFSARIELEATANDGDVLAVGGLEVDMRPLGYLTDAVNAD